MISIFLLIFGFVFLAAVAFAGWVVVNGVRAVWRATTGSGTPAADGGRRRCRNPACVAYNLAHARFCRQCGSSLSATAPPAVTPMPLREERRQSFAAAVR